MQKTSQVQVDSYEPITASALRCKKCGAVNMVSRSHCFRCGDQLRIMELADGTLQPLEYLLQDIQYLYKDGWRRCRGGNVKVKRM